MEQSWCFFFVQENVGCYYWESLVKLVAIKWVQLFYKTKMLNSTKKIVNKDKIVIFTVQHNNSDVPTKQNLKI